MYDSFVTDRLIDIWLAEDIGACDLTVQVMIEPGETGKFHMNAREPMIVAGVEVAARVFKRYDPELSVKLLVKDGDKVEKGAILIEVEGAARSVLTAERTALNIAQRLSGIAVETARYVAAIAGTKARLIDTRKTTPGLRALEKYAVRCGGGVNHRFGLDDAILIKDNHVAACGSVGEAVRRAKAFAGHLVKVEVEVDSLLQLQEALAGDPDVIMLDNFTLEDMREAVRLASGRVIVEASGGITLDTVRAAAETGVDVISIGALTHSAKVLDIGLDAVS